MNAKEEFIKHTEKHNVKCAKISKGRDYIPNEIIHFFLKIGYSKDEFNKFLELLDFTYDSGYGGQELYGDIWYEDGTWSSRGEYDGSEWWEYNKCPKIPNQLL